MTRFVAILLMCTAGILVPVGVGLAGESYMSAASIAPVENIVAQTALDSAGLVRPGGNFEALGSTLAITNNCRYGVAGGQADYLGWIGAQNLGIGWNLDFSAHDPDHRIVGSEYVQVIRVLQGRDSSGNYLNTYDVNPPLTDGGLGAVIADNPGSLWLVGNEPDRGPTVPTDPNRVQDDTFPAIYAMAYHDIYGFIKSHDPNAQVANAGLVEVTPGRLQYMDMVWAAYQNAYNTTMPVDVWNMHLYVLPEATHDGLAPNEIAGVAKGTTLALAMKEGTYIVGVTKWCSKPGYLCTAAHDSIPEFGKQVVAMRTWLKAHGQQNKPLILSEFGLLYPDIPDNNPQGCWVYDEYGKCFPPARAAQFLIDSFNYLTATTSVSLGDPLDNNRLVQQWLWYSLNGTPGAGSISDLITPTVPLTYTVVGQAFRDTAHAMPQTINLFATRTQFKSLMVTGDQMTVTVLVGVMNNGSIAASVPTTVTVYANAARTQPMSSGFLMNSPGCARRETFANVSWSLPATATGTYNYYIRIDPGNALGETTMSDNDIQGTLNLTPTRILLPIIHR
jgi:hypothetical protein